MQLVRAGYSVAGSPSALSVKRTMRNSFARRISLSRPTPQEIAALQTQVDTALAADDAEAAEQSRLALDAALRKSRRVPYIDPVDVRYNRFERIPKPNTQAVMFCLMDVSGSMTEQMKDLAKRFFMLLHVFLTRRYKHVDIVFIRHTSSAQEVDEDTFFHSRETGGTIVSTALDEMMRVVRARYNPDNWNIYAAQASDGDNYTEDSDRCASLMAQQILPVCQYFAYIEVGAEATLRHGYPSAPTDLWRTYEGIAQTEHEFRHAQGGGSLADLPGLPRAVLQAEGARGMSETMLAPGARSAVRGRRVGFRQDPPRSRRDRGDRPRGAGPRRLPQPDRGHHLRADARRLCLGRPAAHVPALELRQALRPRRGALPPRPAGPRLRDRHQFQPLHQLHHGGELHGDADAGDRARRLRPQPFLQEQLPVPPVDGRRRHPRLPDLRARLRRPMRGTPRRRARSSACSTPPTR